MNPGGPTHSNSHFFFRREAAYFGRRGGTSAQYRVRDQRRGRNSPPRELETIESSIDDVSSQENRADGGREGFRRGQPHNQALRRPLEPHTRLVAKNYFKLIQAIHHKTIIDNAINNNTFPKGMIKQVHKLTAFIKPSSPTEEFYSKVSDNTTRWMQNNMTLLQDHYVSIIAKHSTGGGIKEALDVAMGWAHKRYGPRFDPRTGRMVESLLFSSPNEHTHVSESSAGSEEQGGDTGGPNPGDEIQFPKLPQPAAPHMKSLYLGPKATMLEQYPQLGKRPVAGPQVHVEPRETAAPSPELPADRNTAERDQKVSTPLPQRQGGGTKGDVGRAKHTHAYPPLLSPIVHTGAEAQQRGRGSGLLPPSPVSLPPAFPPPPSSSSSPLFVPPSPLQGPYREPEGPLPPHPPPAPREPAASPLRDRPTVTTGPVAPERRGLMVTRAEIHREPEHSQSLVLPQVKPKPSHKSRLSLGGARGPRGPQPAPRPTQRYLPQPQGVEETQVMSGWPKVNTTGDLEVRVTEQSTQSEPSTITFNRGPGAGAGTAGTGAGPIYLPTYHKARMARKLQDWSFRGLKPVLFLGDSNLNRIPAHKNQHIQIDSYPGANIYHFLKICEKTPVHTDTKILVLSVGLNNRDQDPHKTSIKQLRALHKRAKSTFPNADIYFPVINFSLSLPEEQQANLREINDHIRHNLPHLTTLFHDRFHTRPDQIHWTPETAEAMFAHWCAQLNL